MRSRIGAAMGFWMAMTTALAGCRSCAQGDAGSSSGGEATGSASATGPTMPTGMLMPVARSDANADAGSAGSVSAAGNLRLVRGAKGGAWTELQIAKPGDKPDRFDFDHWRDESSFVSLDAMTLMHEAFARALPSFDLFLPRLYAPDTLTKLGVELDAFATKHDGDIAKTARDIAALAKATAAAGKSLWVLGP